MNTVPMNSMRMMRSRKKALCNIKNKNKKGSSETTLTTNIRQINRMRTLTLSSILAKYKARSLILDFTTARATHPKTAGAKQVVKVSLKRTKSTPDATNPVFQNFHNFPWAAVTPKDKSARFLGDSINDIHWSSNFS